MADATDPQVDPDRRAWHAANAASGPDDAVESVVTDPLPIGVTFVSADGGGSESGGTVTWNVGTISNVEKRIEFARRIEERSVSGPEASKRWAEAIASIRNEKECPKYRGLVIGPQASDAELAEARAGIVADPRGWIAQEMVLLSTSPTQIGDRLKPRHIDFRPFAVNDGDNVWVVPGGLTRVALPEGSVVVNSSQGGGSKDTWVLSAAGLRATEPLSPPTAAAAPQAAPGMRPDPGPSVTQEAQQQ